MLALKKELDAGSITTKSVLNRIQALEKEYDATLLFGHDIDQITDWAKKSLID